MKIPEDRFSGDRQSSLDSEQNFRRSSAYRNLHVVRWSLFLVIVVFLVAVVLSSLLSQTNNQAKQPRTRPSKKEYMVNLGDSESAPRAYSPEVAAPAEPYPFPGEVTPITPNTETQYNTEEYHLITDNTFHLAKDNPLSTFSIDVDTASYSNLRRFITSAHLPPPDAVRIEELINYFTYDYPQPEGDRPFSITTEISQAPWNPQHQLVHIGLQGKQMVREEIPPSNLVFLLDVSGSMSSPNKLPLVKSSLQMLVNQLSERDRVSIVVYAGAAGLVLSPTPGNQKAEILGAIERLNSGGSTAGGAGIKLAYEVAKRTYIPDGNNRVILATDGDFNVGASSDSELVRLIESYRDRGVFLTVLGFGMGNLKDSKMEQLADKGNGNYGYIDTEKEAQKMLVTEMGGTLLTIAKDVKIQVEFNPNRVRAYRLIGYENRILQDRDFNDDRKDAGELGSGHSVTALYEIIPTGVDSDIPLPTIDPLRYQTNSSEITDPTGYKADELMLVKLRYKHPDKNSSQLIAEPVVDRKTSLENSSNNFKFSAAVAEFGMILRNSEYRGDASLMQVLDLAKESRGADLEGYRKEFIELVETARELEDR